MVIAVLTACNGTLEVGISPDDTPTAQYAHPSSLAIEGKLLDILIPLFPFEEVFLYRSAASFDDTTAVLKDELAASGWTLIEETLLPAPSSGTILRFSQESTGLIEIEVAAEPDSEGVFVILPGTKNATEALPISTIAPTSTITNPNVPLIAAAFDIVETDDQIEYKVNLPLNDVVAFFQTELSTADWYINHENIEPDSHRATLVFIRQDTVMQINIEPDPSSEALVVSITVK